MSILDKLTAALSHEPMLKCAQGMHPSTHAVTCLHHGHLPARFLQLNPSRKPRQPRANNNDRFIIHKFGFYHLDKKSRP